MTTYRVPHRRRFTTVDRRMVNDSRLSFKARGVLLWLLDKPDDWVTTAERIAEDSSEGEYAIRSALKELERAGYLVRTRVRVGSRWGVEWVVHEVCQGAETADGEAPVKARKPRTEPPGVLPLAQVSQGAETAGVTKTEIHTPKTENPAEVATAPPGKGKVNPVAHELAVARWELSKVKPVCGFVALRERVGEALEAGYSREEVGRVLPRMTVFSRNAFDNALRGSGAPRVVERGDLPAGVVELPPVGDAERRAMPAGRIDL